MLTPDVANAPCSQVQMVTKCKQTGHRKAIFAYSKLAHIRSLRGLGLTARRSALEGLRELRSDGA